MLGEVAKVFGVRLGGSGTVICTVLSGLDLEDQFQIHSCLKGTLGVYTSVRPGCLRGSTLPFLRVSNPNVGENRFFLVWCRSKRQLARGVTKWGKTSGETMVIQFGLVIPRGWGHLEVRPRFSEVSVKRFDTHQTSGCFSMKHMDALEIRLQELCFQIALGQNCAARRWMGY